MLKIENILLLVLIIFCALITLTVVGAVFEDDFVNAFFQSDYPITLENQTPLPIKEPELNQDENGWQVFRSDGYAFEIHFPAMVTSKDIPSQSSLSAGIEVPENTPVWEFTLTDPSLYDGTNLINASLIIHISRGSDSLSTCSEYKSGSRNKTISKALPEVEINGNQFWKDSITEGVMGGMYELISYRALYQEACYELTQMIQINNQENYAENIIDSYNQNLILSLLDQILGTFQFLDIQATFPEQIYPEMDTVDQVVEKATGGYADGIDVSHWQGDIGWIKVSNAGYKFAFVKATEGVGYTDPMLANNLAEGKNAGVYQGVYHFARPNLGNTGREEAEYFLSVAGDYLKGGYLRPVLDLEVGSGLGKTALSNWVLEWMQTVENHTGIAPLIYTNLYFINNYLTTAVTEYDLWIAYWTHGCDSTVTLDIPPTGKWNDWAFWQYCVAGSGTVPGINTAIDLDIYNGLEGSLGEYDAASPLWVLLISDTNNAPAPYYADITGSVFGDGTGLINYNFWWDCSSLETDITVLSTICGTLPIPSEGECLENDFGVRCNALTVEEIIVEHTYREVGDYVAKMVVERGGVSLAEDRFQISVYNPILSLTAEPISPAEGSINQFIDIIASVDMKTSINGVLQVDLIENSTGIVMDSGCQSVPDDSTITRNFNLSWIETDINHQNYTLWARYRALENCPISDVKPDDKSLAYKVKWAFDAIGLYRPDERTWYLKNTNSDYWVNFQTIRFGANDPSWLPVAGDWDGDGQDTVGIYSPAQQTWYLKDDNISGWDNIQTIYFGVSDTSWVPLVGDWNGNGQDTIGLFSPDQRTWYLKDDNTNGWDNIQSVRFGAGDPTWVPVAGDWSGDGQDTIGFFSPGLKVWYLKETNTDGWENVDAIRFGGTDPSWKPVKGDWNGDGKDTIGLYQSAERRWFIKDENTNGWDNIHAIQFGSIDPSWLPIVGDWD